MLHWGSDGSVHADQAHLARYLIPQPNTGTHALASACQNRIMLRDAVHHHRDPCLTTSWQLLVSAAAGGIDEKSVLNNYIV